MQKVISDYSNLKVKSLKTVRFFFSSKSNVLSRLMINPEFCN